MKDPRNITPAEFQIIEVLWGEDSPKSVSQIRKQLHRGRQLAYTTVMTLLDKMARKGSVRRFKKGKAYFYRPAVSRPEVLSYLIQDFADCYFNGQIRRLSFILDGKTETRPPTAVPVRRMPAVPSARPGRQSSSGNGTEEEMDIVLL